MNMRPQQGTFLFGSNFEDFYHKKTMRYASQQAVMQVFVRTCAKVTENVQLKY